jgi:hypothetical protein
VYHTERMLVSIETTLTTSATTDRVLKFTS